MASPFHTTKEKLLSKKYTKNVASRLVPGQLENEILKQADYIVYVITKLLKYLKSIIQISSDPFL